MTRHCISMMAALTMALIFITAAQAGNYTSDFDHYLSSSESKDQVSAIITMADRVDLEALKADLSARHADRQQWHEAVVRTLQDKATESQANILAKLEEMKKQGGVSSFENLWLGNLIIITATRDALDELVQRTDIDQIAPNYEIESIKDIESNDTPIITSGVGSNLKAIRADEVWAMGYTGEGRLVSHLDTGVNGNHVALANSWRGNDSRYTENPEWAWYDPITNTDFPFDSAMHGTHTMGTMCGLGESTGDTIGVAFGAEWISAGVIERVSISRTISDAITALEWIADPDEDPSTVWDVPDVCSNSWGVNSSMGYNACDESLWEAIDDAEAAGVVVVFAAGNEGSNAQTLRSPADRATTDLNCFAVGAINGDDDDFPIADFSSRGPSYCTADGSEAIKPEVCAPGVYVRSAYGLSDDDYTYLSGTSMAAPHVAGVVALMREANPDITSDEIKQILLETANDLGDEGNDNNYGMGIIDAYAAVQRALSLREGWGVLTGTITDQATGDPISGAAISVVDRNYSAISGNDGSYYLYMPADTSYNIKINVSPSYLPLYDQQMVAAGETTTVDYALENKVAAIFTVSFGNPAQISYRTFYMKGSWDDNGSYDASWSGDLVALKDNGQSPDETAADGIFTAEVLLARDSVNTYNWSVYTENYGVMGISDAFLASGASFTIDGLEPVAVPTLAPNPSGSDNNFVFSVSGDNGLSLDLTPGFDGIAYKWGGSVTLSAYVSYYFTFRVMHSGESYYGRNGVGGDDLTFMPVADGAYDFIFNDEDDTYLIQPTGADGPPLYPGAVSGLDGHIPVGWLPPDISESVELGYDDGVLVNGWYYPSPGSMAAVMFVPESYPVAIDSAMLRIYTEGDAVWPWPDNVHDPIGISVFLDNGSGYPMDEPAYYTEATLESGSQWLRINVEDITISSGYFWVAFNNIGASGYDGLGNDAAIDYPANQWVFYTDNLWHISSIGDGDHMIRAKVFSNNASTWLGYDDAMPAQEISAPVLADNITDIAVGTSTVPVSNSVSSNMLAYYPHILSEPPVITETETVAGYNLYRSTMSNPYKLRRKINSEIITSNSYDDWGNDNYGPIINGLIFHYQVTAVYELNGSYVEVGPTVDFTATPANHAPNAPVNLVGEVSDHTITLSWDANTDYDIASYNIYRRDYNTYDFNLVGTATSPNTTYSEDITIDGVYRYQIKAIDTGNMESDSSSNYVDLSVGLIPPSALEASTDLEFQIKLEWGVPEGNGGDPDGYKLYKSASEDGDFELIASVAGDIREYIDSLDANDVPYYYQVTAVWGDDESGPSNTIEGIGKNYVSETPTGLTASTDNYTVSLTWAFTNLMGDLDHYNIYRRLPAESEWALAGNSTTESFTDQIVGEAAIYVYCVTAVDNGNPQLESGLSNPAFAPVGSLPPANLAATSNQDNTVPLSWSVPGILPCTTLAYDDGVAANGFYSISYDYLMAKQFIGSAPVSICTVYVHIVTEGDVCWPFPDAIHTPISIQVWDDDGSGQPGSVLAEDTATCELGQWVTVGFESPITCTTDNFWVSWHNTSGYDAMAIDAASDYPGYDWVYDGYWARRNSGETDQMIRAAITIDGVAELLTENNPVSKLAASDLNGDDPQLYDTEEMLGYYIYRSTSPDVPVDDAYRITPSYVTDLQYNDETVTNGTTYYYVTAAAYNNNGAIEISPASNEVSATPMTPGQLAVDSILITAAAEPGDTVFSVPLTLTNTGGLPITFAASAAAANGVTAANPNVSYIVSSQYTVINTVGNESDTAQDITNPPVITDNGGPDNYGYSWIDSDDANGPVYSWVDISGIGQQITDLMNDTNLGPYTMGFDFPFYGNTFSTIRICSNGWISFTSTSTSYNNVSLPSAAEPFNLIAPYWDDLCPPAGGQCYYYTTEDSTVISWINAYSFSDGSRSTFEIILTSDGNIVFQYAELDVNGRNRTIGIQNADGSDGLCISHDSEYLHSEMAIKIKKGWLSVNPGSGTIAAGGTFAINAILDPSSLEIGTYAGALNFAAYDMNHNLDPIAVPVTFVVDIVGIDDDNATLPTTYSLSQNYPNPFNAHTEIKYALPVDSDVQLEIYNVLGQKVVTLVDEKQTAGYHSLIWDGTNESGQVVSSGMYLYKLVTNEDTFVKKMVMLK